jgi:predicted transcriptional regulator
MDERVNRLARQRGVSRGQVVREAVADYLARLDEDGAPAS